MLVALALLFDTKGLIHTTLWLPGLRKETFQVGEIAFVFGMGVCTTSLFFIIYAPCGNRPVQHTQRKKLFAWVTELWRSLPVRCLPILFMDGNAKTGVLLVHTEDGHVLIGGRSAQAEGRAGAVLRDLVIQQSNPINK